MSAPEKWTMRLICEETGIDWKFEVDPSKFEMYRQASFTNSPESDKAEWWQREAGPLQVRFEVSKTLVFGRPFP